MSEIKIKAQKRNQWTSEEVKLLSNAVEEYGCNWFQISLQIPKRNPNQCAQKWKRLKGGRSRVNKFWSAQEDKKLIYLVESFGMKWSIIAKRMISRNSKQCRDRYVNKLDPNLKLQNFSKEEDDLIYLNFVQYGPRWNYISRQLEGRSENQVKNRFYTFIRAAYLQLENPHCSKATLEDAKKMLNEARETHLSLLQKQIQEIDVESCEQLTTEDNLSEFFLFSHQNVLTKNEQQYPLYIDDEV